MTISAVATLQPREGSEEFIHYIQDPFNTQVDVPSLLTNIIPDFHE